MFTRSDAHCGTYYFLFLIVAEAGDNSGVYCIILVMSPLGLRSCERQATLMCEQEARRPQRGVKARPVSMAAVTGPTLLWLLRLAAWGAHPASGTRINPGKHPG